MKKLAATALLLTLLGSTWQTAASQPHGRVDEEAMASWILPTDRPDRYRWLAIIALVREVAGEGRIGYVVPIEGWCERDRGGLACGGGGRIKAIGGADFEMATDLSSGEISFKQRGRTYLARLVGRDRGPGLYASGEYCISSDGEEGQGHGSGFLRDARASGSFAGREMEAVPRRLEFSYLLRGAMVSECDTGPVMVSRSGRDARYRWRVGDAFSAR